MYKFEFNIWSIVLMDKLLIYGQNVNGLRSKLTTFRLNVLNIDADLYLLTETNLAGDVSDAELCDLSVYKIFRRDRESAANIRNKKSGGGVMIGVRYQLDVMHQPSFQSEAEDLWVTVFNKVRKVKIHVCCLYLPPGDDYARSCFTSKLQDNIGKIGSDPVVIFGDFNLPGVDWISSECDSCFIPLNTDNSSSSLLDVLSFGEFFQYSYIKNKNGRMLDLIFCSRTEPTDLRENILPLVDPDSHHPPVEFYVTFSKLGKLNTSVSYFYNFRRADYDKLNSLFLSESWDVLSNLSVDRAVSALYEVLKRGRELHVPKIKILNKKYPVYFSKNTINVLKQKNKIHKKWKRFCNPYYYEKFKSLRRLSKGLIHADYGLYLGDVQEQIRTHPKKFWDYVSNCKRDTSLPFTMKYNDSVAEGGKDICQLFASYFHSVYEPCRGVHQNIPHSGHNDLISTVVFTPELVENKLRSLDESKGAGFDEYPSYFVKHCASGLCLPLSIIFNKSIQSGTFPAVWKTALLVPIYKNSGDKSDVSNYRGISKLSIFGKVFESIVCDSLFPSIRSSILECQHGFYSRRSIETNLVIYAEYIFNALDDGVQVDSVYSDFSKAFDKVDHDVLLGKLAAIGVRGDLLRWLSSYVRGRSQLVSANGYLSSPFVVTSGVPQGSHLGPLLFLIFINDIGDCFQHCLILLYADDLKIFRRIISVEDCIKIQEDLERFSVYCSKNYLKINYKKCASISFTRKSNRIDYQYQLDQNIVDRVEQIKDLGVVFDSKLHFHAHFDFVMSASNKMLGFLCRLCRDFQVEAAMRSLYNSFVLSKLSYGSVVWSPYYSVHKLRFERLQNKFIRFLHFKMTGEYVTLGIGAIRAGYGIQLLEQRRIISDLVFLYKVLRNYYDSPELTSFVHYHVPSRQTRNRQLLHSGAFRTNIGKNSPMTRMCEFFNKYVGNLDIFVLSLPSFRNNCRRIFHP